MGAPADAPGNLVVSLRAKQRAPSSERKSFIVFRLDALGDLVLTTPLFRELKRSYPQAHITAVVQEAYKSILATNPSVDEVLTIRSRRSRWLPKGALHLLAVLSFYRRELQGRRFDVASHRAGTPTSIWRPCSVC